MMAEGTQASRGEEGRESAPDSDHSLLIGIGTRETKTESNGVGMECELRPQKCNMEDRLGGPEWELG